MNSPREGEARQCRGCGNSVAVAQDRIEDFQAEIDEEIYCPTCRHQKHFGVIHS